MNRLLVLPLVLVVLVGSVKSEPLSVDNLDLSQVSQLRFELRNVQDPLQKCHLFWRGISHELGGDELDKEVTLGQLKKRLESRRSFKQLVNLIESCMNPDEKETPAGQENTAKRESESLVKEPAELDELKESVKKLEAEARLKDAKIKELSAELETKPAPQNKEGRSDEVKFLQKERDTAEQQVQELITKLAAQSENFKKLKEAERELNSLKNQMGQLEQQLLKKDELLGLKKAELDRAIERIDALKQELVIVRRSG